MFEDSKAIAYDYETAYDTKAGYSLSCMPTWQYCADDRFDPYLVAICGENIFDHEYGQLPDFTIFRRLDDGRQLYIGRPERFPDWSVFHGRIVVSHNSSFESVVTRECIKRGIIRGLDLSKVEEHCTADLTAYLGVQRNLKAAMKWLFGKEISKEVRALMDSRHVSDLSQDELRDLYEYGGSDAVECHDLWLRYASEWPDVERKISQQNRNAIARGVFVDRSYAESALRELATYERKVVCDIPWASEINPKTKEFYKVGSLPALRQAVINLGIEPPATFAKNSPEFIRWLETHDDIPFIKARQKAVAIAMHSARVKGILDSLDGNGRSHPSFLYFGAHTGRFSGKSSTGGGNVNMLNMPRKPVLEGDENVFGGKGVDIRGMYIPSPGHKFCVFDFSQIEARFSLWLVDDTHMMAALKKEKNLYQANAVAMGWCKSGDNIKKTDPDKYRLAKCCLTGDSLVLVRSENKNGGLTPPYYKRIIRIAITDKVWDGSEWVSHLGVEKMKEVYENELGNIGGVWATHDHKVYSGEHDVNQLGDLLERDKAAAVAWGQSTNPVQGWTHVRLLAAALARLAARAVGLAAWKGVRVLAGAMPLHRVRTRGDAGVAQREERPVDTMQVVCAKSCGKNADAHRLGENS